MDGELSRRTFLRLTAAGAATLALPLAGAACDGASSPRFLSEREWATLEAIADGLLPGASAAGAVAYIDRLLSAFDDGPPRIFAGGPFSGRWPYPDEHGGASSRYPRDDFARFVPLSRTRALAWRVRIYGSARVPGGDYNDGVLGPTVGLRDRYRDELRAIEAESVRAHGGAFAQLTAEQQDAVLAASDEEFVRQVGEHVMEGTYAAAAYGGNRDQNAWRAVAYEGDSQPLGYAIFDDKAGSYREIAASPTSTANLDEDFAGLSAETEALIAAIVAGVGGKRFF